MAHDVFASQATQSKSGAPAMFACSAMAAASLLIIRTLSLSLGVLLVAVLCGILISLALLTKQPADGNLS